MLQRIAEAAAPEHEALVYEIGPGRGALTKHLAPRCDRLVAVELDRTLIAPLQVQFPSVEVVETDVLRFAFPREEQYVVCGNLPYYITSPIVEHVLAIGPGLKRAVFLVQKEVALRLAAQPRSRDYGYLSVITQMASEVEVLFTVSPGAFAPPPKVDSAVVRIKPRPGGVMVPEELRKFVSRCFLQKRKTLRNNLALLYPAIEGRPEAGLRAEQLAVEEFPRLLASLVPALTH